MGEWTGLVEALPGFAALAVASFLAGGVNSIAGGGTILTFPVLGAILPPDPARLVTANVTSTIGLWPSSVSASWAYREERIGQPPWARWLMVPSVIGAIVGTLLLLKLPPGWFDAAVPWLILLAAVLFAVQPQLVGWFARRQPSEDADSAHSPDAAAQNSSTISPGRFAITWVLQFLVAVYGGYFGAGIGILMLAVLGAIGLGDIHRLNAVKNSLAVAINGTSAGVFVLGAFLGTHTVSWPHAAVMAVAAVAGSLATSRIARQLPAKLVRRIVAIIGFALAAYYFGRHLGT